MLFSKKSSPTVVQPEEDEKLVFQLSPRTEKIELEVHDDIEEEGSLEISKEEVENPSHPLRGLTQKVSQPNKYNYIVYLISDVYFLYLLTLMSLEL